VRTTVYIEVRCFTFSEFCFTLCHVWHTHSFKYLLCTTIACAVLIIHACRCLPLQTQQATPCAAHSHTAQGITVTCILRDKASHVQPHEGGWMQHSLPNRTLYVQRQSETNLKTQSPCIRALLLATALQMQHHTAALQQHSYRHAAGCCFLQFANMTWATSATPHVDRSGPSCRCSHHHTVSMNGTLSSHKQSRQPRVTHKGHYH
jgi:hypothetical protein